MSELIKIGVSGKDPKIWNNELRKKLIDQIKEKLTISINRFLDIVINENKNLTIKDEAKAFASALLEFGKAKLNLPVIQNEKIKAEIQEIYSEIELKKATTRKINAEAQEKEFENAIKALKLALIGTKVLLTGEKGRENILFLKKVDAFLPLLEQFNEG